MKILKFKLLKDFARKHLVQQTRSCAGQSLLKRLNGKAMQN